MTNTTYTLQLVPKGYKVVPEEGTREMMRAFWRMGPFPEKPFNKAWKEACEATPPLNTPPVLRWEGNDLCFANIVLSSVWPSKISEDYVWRRIGKDTKHAETEQEARRAAEKALGFPDWLIIPET